MKWLIILTLLLCSCTPLFFGAKVVGPYYKHFDKQLECAFVEGWHDTTKCLCWIPDRAFSQNKTFLAAESNIFCIQDVN